MSYLNFRAKTYLFERSITLSEGRFSIICCATSKSLLATIAIGMSSYRSGYSWYRFTEMSNKPKFLIVCNAYILFSCTKLILLHPMAIKTSGTASKQRLCNGPKSNRNVKSILTIVFTFDVLLGTWGLLTTQFLSNDRDKAPLEITYSLKAK